VCVCDVPCLPLLVFGLAVCISIGVYTKREAIFLIRCGFLLTLSSQLQDFLLGIFCYFFLLEMAYLNEEEILECLYSLPENEYDSEEECDEDAAEELTRLDVSNSGCDESNGSFAEAVDISQEGTEPNHQSSNTPEDESEWGDSVSYFERITRALDQNPVIFPDLTQEDSEVDYLLSILTEEILEIIQDQTKLYATQERER